MNKYTAIFTRDTEDGGWVAQCAEVPSAITQGETLAEARASLKEAVKFMLRVEAQHALKSKPRQARLKRSKIENRKFIPFSFPCRPLPRR